MTGNFKIVNALKESYNREFATMEHKLSSETSVLDEWIPEFDATDVATLLKTFFRELKEPVSYKVVRVLSIYL